MELDQIDGAAPADSTLGMLQRGRGFGWLQSATAPDGVEMLLSCIGDDPRWDRQVESRSEYYATLALRLGIPVSRIAELLDEDEDGEWLPEQVLNDLAERGVAGAADTLRDAGLTPWADELPGTGPLSDEGEKLIDAPIDVVLASAPEHLYSSALRARFTVTTDPREIAALRRCAEDSANPGWVLAVRVLAERGDASALDAAERVLVADGRGRTRPAAIRYVERLPGAVVLPLARQWLGYGDARGIVARGVLAEHAQPPDLDLLRTALAKADGYYEVSDLVRALGRIPQGGPYSEFETIYRESAYSYTRAAVVEAMAATDPEFPEVHAFECLWDCEGTSRLVAVQHARLSVEATARIRELADDAAEDEDVRAAARARLH